MSPGLVLNFTGLFARYDFLRGHGGKRYFVRCPVKYTVVILRRHDQALGRAHRSAQTAEAAVGSVLTQAQTDVHADTEE